MFRGRVGQRRASVAAAREVVLKGHFEDPKPDFIRERVFGCEMRPFKPFHDEKVSHSRSFGFEPSNLLFETRTLYGELGVCCLRKIAGICG